MLRRIRWMVAVGFLLMGLSWGEESAETRLARPYSEGGVRVGIFPFPPFCFMDEKGVAQGLFPDLLREMVADEPWQVEFVPVTWAEGFDGLQTGLVDLMPCVSYSEERTASIDYCKESVAEIWGQVFFRPDRSIHNIDDLEGRRVAVMLKDLNGDNFIKAAAALNVRCKIREFATHAEVFRAVKMGAADAGVVPQHFGYRHAQEYDLVASTIQFAPVSLFFAAAKGHQQELLGLIDGHLIRWKEDPSSIYYHYLNQWMGANGGSGQISKWLSISLGALLGLVALFFVLNAILQKQVRARTRELRMRERQYRGVVESANSIVLRLNSEGEILFVNRYGLEFFGFTVDELIGQPVVGTIVPERVSEGMEIAEEVPRILENPADFVLVENENMRKDGSRVFVQWSNRAVYDDAGALQEMVSIGIDRTAQRCAEDELRKSEQHYRHLFSNMTTGFVLYEMVYSDAGEAIDYRYLEVNPAYEQLTGHASRVLLGRTYRQIFPEQEPPYLAEYEAVTSSGASHSFEQNWVATGIVLASWVFRPSEGQFAVVYSDITLRKQAEAELRLLSTAINQAAEGVLIASPDGVIQYVNPAFENISGYSAADVLGKTSQVLNSGRQSPEFYTQMWQTIRAGKVWSGQLVNRRKDGTLYSEEESISPVRDANGTICSYVSVKRDITHELNLESQYRQAQKMEAVGQLAGGVAHDFNNILQSILGFSELLMATLDNEQFKADVYEIQKAARHGGDLTRQLLTFSRKHHVEYARQDVNQIILDEEKMLARLLGADIKMITRLEPKLRSVNADRVQIAQVIMNLSVNARDAMPEGGELHIITENVQFSEEDAQQLPSAVAGHYVCLKVQDSGSGISEAVQQHLFEPFFTTKEVGKGSGLGLAVIYGIAQQYRGWVSVESVEGAGALFSVYLAAEEEEAEEEAVEEVAAVDWASGHGECILLVEDEPVVQELSKRMLEGSGYKVLCAESAAEARRVLQSGEHVDLLFCDVGLPDESGSKLVMSLEGQYPGMDVMFSSGYADAGPDVEHFKELGYGFVQKPYSVERLLTKVREQLDRFKVC